MERGKSYAFRVTKLSYYQMLKGGNLNGNKVEKQQRDETEEFKMLTEEQQAILEKYDPESNTRSIGVTKKYLIYIGLLAFSLFQLYTAIFGQFPP